MVRFPVILCAALLIAPPASHGQGSYFGRNKVKYTDFDWHVLRTEHFDIYYDREMADLAGRGAAFAEESYAVLATKFNHNVATRIPLVFYSSHLHFQQTNITPGFIPEGVGGFFEFLKRRVVIPYNGSMWDFRHVIRHELVHVFTHSKVNRVLTDHRIRADRLPPLWFIEGLADRLRTMATYGPDGINPSLADRRAFFDDIFSGAGGQLTRPKLLALWKRLALRGEKLFATGTGSDATPATLVVEAQISTADVEEARR